MVRNRQKTTIIVAQLLFFGTSRAFETPNEREMLIAAAIRQSPIRVLLATNRKRARSTSEPFQ
jgi:hypothetical protein